MASPEEVAAFRKEVERIMSSYIVSSSSIHDDYWIDQKFEEEKRRQGREVIIDHNDDRTVWQGNEASLHRRIKELESVVSAQIGAATMTSATIRHEQDILEKNYLHRAIGVSNKVILCGLGGNIVMGPVAGYLTDNTLMMAIIEGCALVIFFIGLMMRPERDKMLEAEKSEIRSRHLLADAVNKDAASTTSDGKEIQRWAT